VTSGESTSICGIAGSSCLPSFMWAVSREDDMALAAAGGADDALRPADALRPKRRAARMMVGGSAIVLQGARGGGGWRRLVASAWYW
jgi:hypothetical protein